jgi:hypothetical protein
MNGRQFAGMLFLLRGNPQNGAHTFQKRLTRRDVRERTL